MYIKSIILTIVIIIIMLVVVRPNSKENFNMNIENLYTPRNASSVWKEIGTNKLVHAPEDKFYRIKKIEPKIPSPPECMCPKCPDCICPKCPSEQEILRKYGIDSQVQINHLPQTIVRHNPIDIRRSMNHRSSHYELVGYLHKTTIADERDKYKILPLYGKEYRGGFFKYYTQFISGDQPFRKMIFKPPNSNRDYSREIYEGDQIEIDSPLNAIYIFKEEKLSNRIDLFDEDPFY